MQIKDLPSSGSLAATDVLAKDASGGTTEKINGSDLASSIKTLGSLLGTSDVVNNLTSTATTAPLSAAQGKALNDKIIGRKPTTLLRPISENQTTEWTYTAPNDGTLYLVFVGTVRSYCSVLWNNAYIGAVAFADNSAPLANTITVNVKKNDIIKVVGLNTNCYLISTQTAFVANNVDV